VRPRDRNPDIKQKKAGPALEAVRAGIGNRRGEITGYIWIGGKEGPGSLLPSINSRFGSFRLARCPTVEPQASCLS